ncbi:hypothetical protein [Xanthovirga aplysinae]|uniref:hypothetical protein n=1 Tax=Xanthovirga aplysinae TaxID=2529853 RepID=UPI0012BC9D73|nr:hypothetical protein [Xanthovirga aplysinae]MTI32624.1 hypothetical protein [Xanthovirga aplysinae]
MKTASLKELKHELGDRSPKELLELCLRLSKFKKENKELLSYLLFEAADEAAFVESVKKEMEEQFSLINTSSYYFINKSVRKILRMAKKYIRYSPNKETEVELLIYFCSEMAEIRPSIQDSLKLRNLYQRQLKAIGKILSGLHEDLQYDYQMELEHLEINI